MTTKDLLIGSAYLKTKHRLPDRFLFTGKVKKESLGDGFLFYLIEVLSPWHSCAKVEKAIVENLKKRAYSLENIESDFEVTLQDINDSLDKLAKNGDSDWVGSLNAVVGYLFDNQICISQAGNVNGYIFRQGKISTITENNRSNQILHPLKTFSDIITGQLAENDSVVFGNTDLYNHFAVDRIRNLVEHNSPFNAVMEFCHSLRRIRFFGANAIVLELKNRLEKREDSGVETPEFVYLDETTPGFLTKLHKKSKEAYKKSKPHLINFSKKAGEALSHGGKKIYSKSKEGFRKRTQPKTNSYQKDAQKRKPVTAGSSYSEKIKTNIYAKKSKSFFLALSKFFSLVFFGIKWLIVPANRKFLYIGLIIIFLLFGYLKIKNNNFGRNTQQQKEAVVLAYDQANEKFDQAKEDIALGRNKSVAPLLEALALAQKAQGDNGNKDKAVALTKEIQSYLDTTNHTSRIYSTDGSIKFNQSIGKTILAGTDAVGVDSDGKIYTLNTSEQVPRLVASLGKDSGGVIGLTYIEASKEVLIYTDKNKIIVFDAISKTTLELTNIDNAWVKATAIDSFVTNVYLLDSENGKVIKHTKSENAYSKASSYLDIKKISIKGAIDLAIDGNVYILQGDGTTMKFVRGVPETTFSLKAIPEPGVKVEQPAKIFTDADTNYLYILDKKYNRVVRFNKTGEFVNQYALDGVNLEDFIVNSKAQKLWLLGGGNLYEIKI